MCCAGKVRTLCPRNCHQALWWPRIGAIWPIRPQMLLGARNRAVHVLVVLVLIVHRDMLPIIGLSLLNISTGPCFTKRLWGHQPTTNISVKVNEVLTRRFHADGISQDRWKLGEGPCWISIPHQREANSKKVFKLECCVGWRSKTWNCRAVGLWDPSS